MSIWQHLTDRTEHSNLSALVADIRRAESKWGRYRKMQEVPEAQLAATIEVMEIGAE